MARNGCVIGIKVHVSLRGLVVVSSLVRFTFIAA
jgi:hypothetical protein